MAIISGAAEEGKLVVINENKAAEMLVTIGVQPSEVSCILDLAKDTLSQVGQEVKQFSVSDKQTETEDEDQSIDTPSAREQLPRKVQEYRADTVYMPNASLPQGGCNFTHLE